MGHHRARSLLGAGSIRLCSLALAVLFTLPDVVLAQSAGAPRAVKIDQADLHVWEGMFHGFFYNIDVPELRDCDEVVVKFFERHLGEG